MSRRKRSRPRIAPPGQSFASDLPRVRDWIVERRLLDAGSLTAHAGEAFQRLAKTAGGSDLVSQLVGRYRDEAAAYASEECALWWVTRAMTRLAYEAREDLPDWTPSMSRPSRCGVLLWDGGCGITPSTLPTDAPQLAVEHVLDSLERWEAQYDRSPNHDIWRDCIMLLDGYDDDASGLVAESSMDGFVAAGQLYDYDYQRKQWFHVGPFDPADYDE